MNPVLTQILETRTVARRDGSAVALNSAISADEGHALDRLIRRCRPRTTLEVGLAHGVSALFICDALSAVGGERHIVIDPDQHAWDGLGLLNLERAGYATLVEYHDALSHAALPALHAAGRRLDFAFIDGWHTFDYALVDFFYVDLMLNVGGLMVLDDAWSYPALRKLARYIATHRRYTLVDSAGAAAPSAKRRLLNTMSPVLRAPVWRGMMTRIARPDVIETDAAIGLPAANLLAFAKTADDVLGNGSNGTRRWDQHHDF
jgi:predicted O-methyltransferase YrrM